MTSQCARNVNDVCNNVNYYMKYIDLVGFLLFDHYFSVYCGYSFCPFSIGHCVFCPPLICGFIKDSNKNINSYISHCLYIKDIFFPTVCPNHILGIAECFYVDPRVWRVKTTFGNIIT